MKGSTVCANEDACFLLKCIIPKFHVHVVNEGFQHFTCCLSKRQKTYALTYVAHRCLL